MSALSEFTGVGAIPAGPAGGPPKVDLKRKKKPRIVDAFLAVASSPSLREEMPVDSAQEPVADTTPTPAVSAPPPSPVPVPSTPPEAVVAPAAPTGESLKALMLSREVVEALAAGHSVNVRGVLLEPTFKVSTAKPAVVAEDVAARVQSTVASVLESTVPGAAPAFSAVNMDAPQPAPSAPSDGRAVMSAFRRFGGVGT